MSKTQDEFAAIDPTDLSKVSGGAARVASAGGSSDANDQLLSMLTEIGNSIKDLAANNNGGGDQMMQMMMMMMMMGGIGGGGGGGGPVGYAQPPTYVEVTGGGGGGCGRKGW